MAYSDLNPYLSFGVAIESKLQIEKNILSLRLQYFLFLRTMVSDLSKESLKQAMLRIQSVQNSKFTELKKQNRIEKLQLLWYVQSLAQKSTDTFARHISESMHHSLLIHLKWKRLLIKRIFIVPYRNRVQHKFFFSKYMSFILEDKE